ncbi:MAG: lysophospholipid acyltransferase family protein [Terracidiphilus sp.]|nr:lysophospholipid acyltransferase family protein [Terracidiphilus sp.]
MTVSTSPEFSRSQRFVLAVVPRLTWGLLRLLGLTWRFEVIAEEGSVPVLFGDETQPEIYCFWHQCVLPGDIYFRRSRAVLLISQSFDGELITRTAQHFGYTVVRGSSSRGASEALVGLRRSIESGRSAIFTADGPRGPVFRTKRGPVKLAQMTGAPIHSFHVQPERFWALRSWDSFMVPKPFTRIVVSWTRPVQVPADLAADQFEPKREELNAAIERARHLALDHFRKAQA